MSSDRKARLTAFGSFLVIAFAIAALGVWYYQREVGQIAEKTYSELRGIAELQVQQIARWRMDRKMDAVRFARMFPVETLIESLNRSDARELRDELAVYLQHSLPESDAAMIFDPDGQQVLSVGANPQNGFLTRDPALPQVLQKALKSQVAEVADLFRSPEGQVWMDVAVALRDSGGQAVAVLVLRNSMDREIYPLLHTQTEKLTGMETFLIQKSGDDVLFLSESIPDSNVGNWSRAPLSKSAMPAVQAALGKQGRFQGIDYRGEQVLSFLLPIQDAPWSLVAKRDLREITKEAARSGADIIAAVIVLVMLAASLVAFVYRTRQEKIAVGLLDAEKARLQALENYQRLFVSMLNGFALHEVIRDHNGKAIDYRFLAINPAFEHMTGLKSSEVIGHTIKEIMPDVEPVWITRYGQLVETREPIEFEDYSRVINRHYRIKAFWTEGDQFASMVDDITGQKDAAARIQKLTKLYSALSRCNQSIVHCADSRTLFDEICRIVVEEGGMKMAWVGLLDETKTVLRAQTAFGEGVEYLTGIEISLDAESPNGCGPTGTAIRENHPVWCHDFANDPSTEPWHERGVRYGWGALVCLPLRLHGKAIGGFTIYSSRPHDFDEEMRHLLNEMMQDINFALENLERNQEQQLTLWELKKLSAAVEQAANAVVITNTDCIIEYVNPAFEKITGYSKTEAIGQNAKILKSGAQNQDFYKTLWDTITAGKTWQGQFRNKRKDGSLYWEAATISPVFDDEGIIRHFIAIKEDISKQKSLENDLIEALGHAEAANRAKSEFLAVMSHELRTPLNGVLGFADLMAETPLEETQVDFLNTIRSSGNHLLQVVNDILDFSSIEKGRMTISCEPVHIARLVENAGASIRNTAKDKGLRFTITLAPDLPEIIQGDTRRLSQILINLLGNAVKFTFAGSVTLRVRNGDESCPATMQFIVEDTGPGIAEETLPKLFQPFSQGDSSLDRPFEGTGLGLAISQRLAEAMNGKITVQSILGKGSVFTLTVPLEPPDTPGSASTLAPISHDQPTGDHAGHREASTARHHILIVEDDRVSGLLAKKILQSLGHTTELASQGQQAVDAYAPGKFTIILMDMQMPVMDGIEATRQIRARESGPRVPIIALTANVMPGDRDRCLAAGMDDFLTKPLKKPALIEKLESIAVSA